MWRNERESHTQFRTVFISVFKNRQFQRCEVRNCGNSAASVFLIAFKEWFCSYFLTVVKTVCAVTLVVNIFILSVNISSHLWIQRYIHKNVRSLVVERYMFYIKMYFDLFYAHRSIHSKLMAWLSLWSEWICHLMFLGLNPCRFPIVMGRIVWKERDVNWWSIGPQAMGSPDTSMHCKGMYYIHVQGSCRFSVPIAWHSACVLYHWFDSHITIP